MTLSGLSRERCSCYSLPEPQAQEEVHGLHGGGGSHMLLTHLFGCA